MDKIGDESVRELRCRYCRAFITYERIIAGVIVHRCSKCGELNQFEFKFLDTPSVRAMIESRFIINKKPKGGENII